MAHDSQLKQWEEMLQRALAGNRPNLLDGDKTAKKAVREDTASKNVTPSDKPVVSIPPVPAKSKVGEPPAHVSDDDEFMRMVRLMFDKLLTKAADVARTARTAQKQQQTQGGELPRLAEKKNPKGDDSADELEKLRLELQKMNAARTAAEKRVSELESVVKDHRDDDDKPGIQRDSEAEVRRLRAQLDEALDIIKALEEACSLGDMLNRK